MEKNIPLKIDENNPNRLFYKAPSAYTMYPDKKVEVIYNEKDDTIYSKIIYDKRDENIGYGQPFIRQEKYIVEQNNKTLSLIDKAKKKLDDMIKALTKKK